MMMAYLYTIVSGIGTVIWSPLASGILTGKYDDGVPIYYCFRYWHCDMVTSGQWYTNRKI